MYKLYAEFMANVSKTFCFCIIGMLERNFLDYESENSQYNGEHFLQKSGLCKDDKGLNLQIDATPEAILAYFSNTGFGVGNVGKDVI